MQRFCFEVVYSSEHATTSVAPASSSISASPLTDSTGRWTVDYARLRYTPLRDTYFEGQNITLLGGSPFSVWHRKVTLESTGCTKCGSAKR